MVAVASFAADNPYGAHAHVTRGEPARRTCAMIRQAGMGWVRADLDWCSIERKKGVWDFTYCDKILAEIEAEGVQLLPVLGFSVPWANPAHEHLDAWEEYVRRVVTHYGRRLPVLEVWNEENISGFWKDPNPTNYLALLRRTYETAKKIEPNVRIAFGGTSGVPFEFIEEVYRLGGAKWFDIMNIHPYTHPRRPEGAMDAQIEKLRAMMAKYGDARKPIWITELGWPTHSLGLAEAGLGLLPTGLKAARPELDVWRMLYVPVRDEEEAAEFVLPLLRNVLPKGSSVEVCRPPDLAERLAKGGVDGVVYPFTEHYASDSADAVHAFVKDGGVLVAFGGIPMSYAYRADAGGEMRPDKRAEPWKDRRRLRIAEKAWWFDKRYPKEIPVFPSAAAKGASVPPKGFKGERFFTPDLLQKGDAFIPLLSAPTNGVEAVAAAVYKFNSDMKGAVVVGGIFMRGSQGTSTEGRQAMMVARSLGIAFAEGIENFFWYEFRQPDENPYDPESYFGMVHDNFAPKPAYGAYMTFVDARPTGSVQTVGSWRSADGTVYFPQWTRPDKRKAGMIWTTKDAHERKLTFTAPDVTFLDVAGARVRPERTGNVVTLMLSDSPIYFFGGELKDLP